MKNLKDNIDNQITSGKNISFWTDSFTPPLIYVKPDKNYNTDVVIVGGGIAGITIAYCLLKSGKKIVLVEDGQIGSGETGRTTAHLVNALDDRYYDLERIYGEEATKLIAKSHSDAIDFVEQIITEENIACDFKRVDGYLFLHPSDKIESLEKELDAAGKAGINVRQVANVPGMKNESSVSLLFPRQGQFHPMKYLLGLSKAITKMGGQIFTGTHAKEIDETGVITDDGIRIKADYIVVATNSPVNNKVVMHLKQYPYRTYVIAATIKKRSLPSALWWDTGDQEKDIPPYHYARTHSYNEEYDLLICGGEDHPTGLADNEKIAEEERYALIEAWTRTRFDIEEIIYRWSGQVMEPMDSLAYIGKNPLDKDNVFIVTGDSGNGMTHGTIAGKLITDLINGKENPLEKIYNPSRFKFFKSGMTFLKEFGGGLAAYLKTYPKDADAITLSSIKPGEAEIVELNKKKHGAYRDENNQLHIVNAECTHLQCIIKWNNDEKSWDCPCHGSRFTFRGEVINGPANKNLDYFSE